MSFANLNLDLSYWQKQEKPLFSDLFWNIPEQKKGHIGVIGGNSQNFHAIIRLSEYLANHFPLEAVPILLPDSLRDKLPPLANITFAPSTESGSFAKSFELEHALAAADFTILAGDFSRNAATAAALASAIQKHQPPLLLTRDAIDLLAPSAETFLRQGVLLVVSMAQLQKIFRAIFYPRMIMLSAPLLPTIETLHKFTLSYPVTILTFHEKQIIVASAGKIITTPLALTEYSPLTLWSGPLAGRVAAMNFYNPNQHLAATAAAIFSDHDF